MILLWIVVGLFGVFCVISLWTSRRVAAARRSGLLPAAGRATMADVERLARSGERIYAIRCYREIHGCGLAEAKKAIDELYPDAT